MYFKLKNYSNTIFFLFRYADVLWERALRIWSPCLRTVIFLNILSSHKKEEKKNHMTGA